MFISVVANNGFGVFDSIEKYYEKEFFMKKPERKEHSTLAQAKKYALDLYNDYHNDYEDIDYYYEPENDPEFRINWFYSKKYIKKLNNSEDIFT